MVFSRSLLFFFLCQLVRVVPGDLRSPAVDLANELNKVQVGNAFLKEKVVRPGKCFIGGTLSSVWFACLGHLCKSCTKVFCLFLWLHYLVSTVFVYFFFMLYFRLQLCLLWLCFTCLPPPPLYLSLSSPSPSFSLTHSLSLSLSIFLSLSLSLSLSPPSLLSLPLFSLSLFFSLSPHTTALAFTLQCWGGG